MPSGPVGVGVGVEGEGMGVSMAVAVAVAGGAPHDVIARTTIARPPATLQYLWIIALSFYGVYSLQDWFIFSHIFKTLPISFELRSAVWSTPPGSP